MWLAFRALAKRIGLAPSEIERVEGSGLPTLVQDPIDPRVSIMVRPDPDWAERLAQAWSGTLANSRQEWGATITASNGELFIACTESPDKPIVAEVARGEYELILTIAHDGSEATGDYDEKVSHLVVVLRDHSDVSSIEPLLDERGDEIDLPGYRFMLSGHDILAKLAGDHAGQWALRASKLMHPEREDGTKVRLYGAKLQTDDIGEAILFYGGRCRGDYPLYRIADVEGRTIGIMADFLIDNRPWPESLAT